MTSNISLAKEVLESLIQHGVRTFCLCPGGRNSPLVHLLSSTQGYEVYNFFDERSAAFFAVGRMKRDRSPVAVITTSGTAVAELLPATIEAFYSSLPLFLITADRPKKYRGTGAPQSIEQRDIFSPYTAENYDLEISSDLSPLHQMKSLTSPCHINLCFDEPLIDDQKTLEPAILQENDDLELGENFISPLENHIKKHPCPLVILGEIPENFRSGVGLFLKKLQAPVYAETLSGLRFDNELPLLKGGEKAVEMLIERKHCTSILHIGGIPTLRFWRDLEHSFSHLPVLTLSSTPFSGRTTSPQLLPLSQHLGEKVNIEAQFSSSQWEQIFQIDRSLFEKTNSLLSRFPYSEPALIRAVSKMMATHSQVYLGNSLPIREWDLASEYKKFETLANRGANGIDGQVSSFLGSSSPDRENWALLGDLTTLYDMNGFWISSQLSPRSLNLVVINNSGGQIFSQIFKDPNFINSHSLHFDHLAQMWGWSYQRWENHVGDITGQRNLIELIPNQDQSNSFWNELKGVH